MQLCFLKYILSILCLIAKCPSFKGDSSLFFGRWGQGPAGQGSGD